MSVAQENIILGRKARQGIAPLRVRILHNSGELESIADAWSKMPVSGTTPMQDVIWYLSCVETLLDRSQLAVTVVEDNAGLRAVAPLMRSTAYPGGYEQLGVRALHEPCDLFYTDTFALNILLGTLSQSREPLVLGRLRAEAATVTSIRHAFAGKGLVVTRHCSGLPYISLNASGDAEGLLSGHLRRDLRRARRKAERAGRVSFEIHAPTSREFLPLFEDVLKVEAAGWKARLGSDLLTNAERRNFFRRYGLRAAGKGILRIAFMRIDSEPVAVQFAVQTGGGFWLLKIGYDEAYSKCSPGMLLMLETLRFAKRQGLASYEFLGSSEQWTRRWTQCERPTIRTEIYPFTARSMIALGRETSRYAWVKARRKFRRQ